MARMRLQPRRTRVDGTGRRRHPRLRAGIVGVVAAAAQLAACGGSDGGLSKGAEQFVTTTTRPLPTATQLQSALLTLTDMPPGWSVVPADAGSSSGFTAVGDPSSILCPGVALPQRTEQHAGAGVTLTKSDLGPQLMQELGAAEDAQAHYDDVLRVFGSCVGQTWPMASDGSTLTMTMQQVSGPQLGDQSTSYRLTGTGVDVPVTVTAEMTVIRRGQVDELYLGMSEQSPYFTADQLSPEQFAALVTTADQKVASTVA